MSDSKKDNTSEDETDAPKTDAETGSETPETEQDRSDAENRPGTDAAALADEPDPEPVSADDLADLSKLDGADPDQTDPDPTDPETLAAETEPSEDTATDVADAESPADDSPEHENPQDDTDDRAADTMSDATPEQAATDAGDSPAAVVEPDARAEPAPKVIRETTIERRGGFIPMLLGGVAAAAIGFGAAQMTGGTLPFLPQPEPDPFRADTQQALSSLTDSVAGLESRIDTVATTAENARDTADSIDTAPLSEAVASLESALAEVNGSLSGFEDRITALEKQPMEEAVSPETIAAYERELADLRDTIAEQRGAVDAARSEIEAIAASARESEVNAEAQASLAASRSAMARVSSALQAGQPFAEDLSVLAENDVDVPAPLQQTASEGVPSPSLLIAEFPDAARAALSAARTAEMQSEDRTLGDAFSAMLGARSVTPQEGDDPDAVLSRAEDALRRGDLAAALSEIGSLPDTAQAAMADWVAMAETRQAALDAASALSGQLNEG